MNENVTSARTTGTGCGDDDTIVSLRPSISFADDKTIAISKENKNVNNIKIINYVNKVEKVHCNLRTAYAVDQNNEDKKFYDKNQQLKEGKPNYVGSLVKCRFE